MAEGGWWMMAPIGEPLGVPVVLAMFNRPETTVRVLERISHQAPTHLFVLSDGARADHPDDASKVAETRGLIEQINWPCRITRIYSESNLGCRAAMLNGLNQVFDEVPAAIILEDDCLPSEDFFKFSRSLLAKYVGQPQVFSIGGNIWEFPDDQQGESYFFSKYFSCWGWATWADRWKGVDSTMGVWPSLRLTDFIPSIADSPMEIVYWERVLESTYRREAPLKEAWDYSVQLAMWLSGSLAIRPRVNLVQNIGLTEGGTHTRQDSPAVSQRPANSIRWPLRHPESVLRAKPMDELTNEVRLGGSLRHHLATSRKQRS